MAKNFPHVQAAHINALAEEGTREELINWLQDQWNEICAYRKALQPFADCVFYDNGDCTVDYSNAKYEDYIQAYFVSRKGK